MYNDTVALIMAFESGQLPEKKMIRFFQDLIDTGLAWQLQGGYSRTARDLIDCGACHEPIFNL